MPYRPQAAIWSPNPAARSPLRAAVVGFAPVAAGLVIASVASMNLVTRLGRKLSLGAVIGIGVLSVLAVPLLPRKAQAGH